MAISKTRQKTAVSLRVKPEIDRVWAGLSEYMHMNRTQVVEQALLRMGRQEGLIKGPRPIQSHATIASGPVEKANLSEVTSPAVEDMRYLLNELASVGPVRSIPTPDLGRDVIYDDHD